MQDAMDLPVGTKIKITKLHEKCGWSNEKWIEGLVLVMGKEGNYHARRGNTKVTEKGFDNSAGFYFLTPEYELITE